MRISKSETCCEEIDYSFHDSVTKGKINKISWLIRQNSNIDSEDESEDSVNSEDESEDPVNSEDESEDLFILEKTDGGTLILTLHYDDGNMINFWVENRHNGYYSHQVDIWLSGRKIYATSL